MSVSRDRHIRVLSPNVIVSIPHIDAVDTLSGVFRGRCSADHVKTVGYHVEGGKAPRRPQRYRFQPSEKSASITAFTDGIYRCILDTSSV